MGQARIFEGADFGQVGVEKFLYLSKYFEGNHSIQRE
jgi:hypothetical protein